MRAKRTSTRAKKSPNLKRAKHQLTHAQAQRARNRFLTLLGPELDFSAPMLFSRRAFDKLLAHPRAAGVRYYPAVADDGAYTLLFCAIDAKGNDLTDTVVGCGPLRCPPWRSAPNSILQP
ncbi:MAG: hypothetical protein AB7S39_10470 [Gemmatimonadales bacterium]